MDSNSPCPHGAGGAVDPRPVSSKLIKETLERALSDIGYQCPNDLLANLVAKSTPIPSRASSQVTSNSSSRASSNQSSRSASSTRSTARKGKRQASEMSDDDATGSDSTVVASDSDASESNDSNKPASTKESFTLVQGKKVIKKAKAARRREATVTVMETDNIPAVPSVTMNAGASSSVTASGQSTENHSAVKNLGSKPTAPPRGKVPPPFYLRKGSNFIKVSADCTRLRINYTKAVRVADDNIKITVPDVETFRKLNKYLIENNIQFHTYALDEELCGLSGIRVENPHKRLPGQCHRCQRYGHASANCHARCVKCLVPHWTKECPLTKESAEKPSCVNCGANHTANYKGCPKAPKVIPRKTHKADVSQTSKAKLPPVQNYVNFPSLGAKKPTKATDDGFVPAPAPSTNPWEKPAPEGRTRTATSDKPARPSQAAFRAFSPNTRLCGSLRSRHPNGDVCA
ncbi:Nucleic-acid-binding protein from transposon X-element [Eumeta japonica]|uniref:Nucleic-acid-binding protein from transposon X-element n=1 Tax=Eumeta variegata TaxID=151549 RepID=A0A4C2A1H8_EUMVA|nr:Nucleic-acid-binding protein from transposon X-element [Eumeta japonica]